METVVDVFTLLMLIAIYAKLHSKALQPTQDQALIDSLSSKIEQITDKVRKIIT